MIIQGLEFEKYLFGTIPFGRFSYAMTSVGDINHDGCDGMCACTYVMNFQCSPLQLYSNTRIKKIKMEIGIARNSKETSS